MWGVKEDNAFALCYKGATGRRIKATVARLKLYKKRSIWAYRIVCSTVEPDSRLALGLDALGKALNKANLAALRFLRFLGFLFGFVGFVGLMQAFEIGLLLAGSFRGIEDIANRPVRLIARGAGRGCVRGIELRSFNGIFTAFW